MMRSRLPLLVAATLLGSASALVYADTPGLLPANTVWGNATASRAQPKPATVSSPLLATGGALSLALTDARIYVGNASNVPVGVALSGDATIANTGALTLATSGVSAGTYTKLTVDAKGRATVGATAACADLSDDGAGCTAGAASTGTAGIVKLHNVPIAVGWPAALDPAGVILANVVQASTISAIVGSVETPVGATATLSIYKAPSGTPCGAGTVLHSGTFNANGTAATNQTLTVTSASLAAGDRICLQTTDGSNWTGGVGIGTVTVFLAPS